jgi:hypothetical protein
MLHVFQARMRDGDAMADAGGAKPLTLNQRIEDDAGINAGGFRGAGGEILKHLLLAARMKARENAFGRNQIREIHICNVAARAALQASR